MKALVKANWDLGLQLQDVAVPKIGPADVLLKVKATALCGSDLHVYHSTAGMQSFMKLPLVLGHETCGEVVEVGAHVHTLRVGDMVSVEPHLFDGTCYYCQNGAALNCENMKIFGIHVNGAFAEYAIAPAHCCWKHPTKYPVELGAILEPIGVAVHSLMVGPIGGKTVAVVGAGPIGMFAARAASVFGATKVYAIEVAPKRLALLKSFAPDAIAINPKETDAVQTVMEGTRGLGVDVVIELSGNKQGIALALQLLKREGRLSLTGVPDGAVELYLHRDVINKEATVRGVYGREVWQTWWQVRDLLETGKFDPLAVVTHRFSLDDHEKAFKLAETGEAGKVVFVF